MTDEDFWGHAYCAHATGLHHADGAQFTAQLADQALEQFRSRYPMRPSGTPKTPRIPPAPIPIGEF